MKTKIGAKTNTDLLEKLMDYYSVTQGYSACKATETKPSELGSDSDLFICSKSKLCKLIQLGNDYGPLSLASFQERDMLHKQRSSVIGSTVFLHGIRPQNYTMIL